MPRFTIRPADDAEYVPLASGIAAQSPLYLHVDDTRDYDVELKVVAIPATADTTGRFECTEVCVRRRAGGPEVSSEALRGIAVSTLVRGVGARMWEAVEHHENAISFTDYRLTDEKAELLRLKGPGNPETLEWVARSYRLALVLGDNPTHAVEKALGIPRSTAGRWIARARRDGYLSSSEGQGKAGG